MGRGKARASLDLIDAAYEILAEIQPATIRAVCYRLFVQGVIPSMEKVNTNKVSRQLTWAREHGEIPWEWVVDETREAERVPSWDTPEEILLAASRQYRKDAWSLQPRRVEVWSEKGTVRGTLAPVLEQYGVTFRVMHGYASATAVHEVATTDGNGKPLVALYVGDWDPSGLHMSEVDLPARLSRYRLDHVDLAFGPGTLRRVAGYANLSEPETVARLVALYEENGTIPRMAIERIALTAEDVADPDLPPFDADTKRGDPRWAWYRQRYGPRAWELDALSPVILRERVETAIRDLIEPEAWERCARAEAAERESLAAVVGAYQESKSRQASV